MFNDQFHYLLQKSLDNQVMSVLEYQTKVACAHHVLKVALLNFSKVYHLSDLNRLMCSFVHHT